MWNYISCVVSTILSHMLCSKLAGRNSEVGNISKYFTIMSVVIMTIIFLTGV